MSEYTKLMWTSDIINWIDNNPNNSIYVMVRIDFKSSVKCKITRQECLRFLKSVHSAQTDINSDGHLIIGL